MLDFKLQKAYSRAFSDPVCFEWFWKQKNCMLLFGNQGGGHIGAHPRFSFSPRRINMFCLQMTQASSNKWPSIQRLNFFLYDHFYLTWNQWHRPPYIESLFIILKCYIWGKSNGFPSNPTHWPFSVVFSSLTIFILELWCGRFKVEAESGSFSFCPHLPRLQEQTPLSSGWLWCRTA